MRRIIVSYSQAIRIARLDSEHGQIDGKVHKSRTSGVELSNGSQFLVLTKLKKRGLWGLKVRDSRSGSIITAGSGNC